MKLQFYQDLLNSSHLFSDPAWQNELTKILEDFFTYPGHGNFLKWQSAVDQLPANCTNHSNFNAAVIEIGKSNELSKEQHANVIDALHELQPWRKGPFNFFGAVIDSEWRCEKKWNRIKGCLPSLKNKKILDVGCGNGYYMLRMYGAGAETVIGVDPTHLFLAQHFALMQSLVTPTRCYLLPIAFEAMPQQMIEFDIIFSMGVLYHRRDPQEHLQRLFHHTKPGGMIVLETLIIDDPEISSLIPEDRYAGMRNVWCVPSPGQVIEWLNHLKFENVQLHNIDITDFSEQRTTAWTNNYSLENFLNPSNLNKTIEGYPRPTRAIFTATRSNT